MVSEIHFGQPHIKGLGFRKFQGNNIWDVFTGVIKVSYHNKDVTFLGTFLKRVM
jgi:hypothetical protein